MLHSNKLQTQNDFPILTIVFPATSSESNFKMVLARFLIVLCPVAKISNDYRTIDLKLCQIVSMLPGEVFKGTGPGTALFEKIVFTTNVGLRLILRLLFLLRQKSIFLRINRIFSSSYY